MRSNLTYQCSSWQPEPECLHGHSPTCSGVTAWQTPAELKTIVSGQRLSHTQPTKHHSRAWPTLNVLRTRHPKQESKQESTAGHSTVGHSTVQTRGTTLDPCRVVTGCPAPAEGITGHRQPCQGSNFRIRSTGLANAGRLGTTTGWAKGPRAEPPRAGTGVLAPAHRPRRRARPTETEEMGPSASETRDV